MKRALFIIALFVALAMPQVAFAADGGYSIDELSTEVTVETNATTHVIERQVVTFDTRNMGYVWYLHVPEDGESVYMSSIRVAPVDDGGTLVGDWTRLQLIDSNPRMQGTNPGDTANATLRSLKTQPWYSYNIGDGMVRCWFPTGSWATLASPNADEAANTNTYLIEADYRIAHRVRVYRDVAELYWRYANSSLPVDASDVNLQVALPVPADTPVEPGVDVRAWGHGPDGGTFEVNPDGTVTYHLDMISRGNYAEAHVLFPASWMTNMAPGAANWFTELREAAAVAEETQWVDASMRGATWDNKVRVIFLSVAAVVLLVGAIAVARLGRTQRSRRALVRTAATLAIVALGAQLFFREPLTTLILGGLAAVVAFVSLALPNTDEVEIDDEYSNEDPDESPTEDLDEDADERLAEELGEESDPSADEEFKLEANMNASRETAE